MPGWQCSTLGIQSYAELPQAARNYLERIEALCGVPVDIVSTGPDRKDTIVRRHPLSIR
jgi:adenylosuccinate synthase